jgi:integrase
MPKLPPPKVEFLTPEESLRVVQAAPAQWRTMILTAMRTGMRLGELLALRWENVDFPACKIIVRASAWRDQIVTTKNGRVREVPMTDSVRQALLEHRAGQVARIDGGWVFAQPDGSRCVHRDVQNVMTRACRASGIAKEVSWHKGGRHTFASALAASGRVSLQTVQELGGWANLDMVQRYAHLLPNAKREAVAVLEPDQGTTKPSADSVTSQDSSKTTG